MISTDSCASTSWPPSVALTVIGYWPAGTLAGGFAVTVIVADELALTGTLEACVWPDGLAWTCQPSGPLADTANVRSSGVSFVRVRVKVNVVPDAPLSDGKSEARVTSPPAVGLTWTSRLSVLVPPDDVARTVAGTRPGAASAGTSISRVTLPAAEPVPADTATTW